MTTIIANSFLEDIAKGNVDCDSDTFYVMAMGAAYAESKSHAKRSDFTNEVVGSGYTAGGMAATVTVTKDNVNNRLDITLGAATWPTTTLTGVRKFGYYKRRGGLASADEIVAVIDNGSDVATSSGPLALTASTLRIQN
jgi:hypothetical protein